MKTLALLFLLLAAGAAFAQPAADTGKVAVMTLGTFHFAYPNLDVIKTEKKDQLDILSAERQREVEQLVHGLALFKPTKIAIEVPVQAQARIDKEYALYLKDSFALPKGEHYQVGFRLARLLGHPKLYCIDAWGNIDYFITSSGDNNFTVREERKRQMERFEAFTDSVVKAGALERQKLQAKSAASYQTLPQILAAMNTPEALRRDHSTYFGARFQFEAEPYDYTGTDWLALTWYSRNLRIFRNVLRLTDSKADRLLLIYGAGHAYLLHQFFSESLTHRPVSPLPYLK